MDPNLLAAIGGVITASGVVATGFLSTRSKVKLDDIASLQTKLDTANEKLDTERKARSEDRADMQTRHDGEIASLERRVAMLTAQIEERDKAINRLDRVVLALRTYISRLLRVFADRDEEPPPRPAELDA
jgi:chromosome segregation ATPase